MAGVQMISHKSFVSTPVSYFGSKTLIGAWFRSESGAKPNSLLGAKPSIGSRVRKYKPWSLIENVYFLRSNTQVVDMKIIKIFTLNPRFFISKQLLVGFKLKGNQLELGQEFKKISSDFVKPEVPIFMLKEMEIAVKSLRRKVNFCLIGEEFWMVFR